MDIDEIMRKVNDPKYDLELVIRRARPAPKSSRKSTRSSIVGSFVPPSLDEQEESDEDLSYAVRKRELARREAALAAKERELRRRELELHDRSLRESYRDSERSSRKDDQSYHN